MSKKKSKKYAPAIDPSEILKIFSKYFYKKNKLKKIFISKKVASIINTSREIKDAKILSINHPGNCVTISQKNPEGKRKILLDLNEIRAVAI
jgi:hypothetical protein